MASRRASYDIRPPGKYKKKWSDLSKSGKQYWRNKIDVRPPGSGDRRSRPLDTIRTAASRTIFTREQYQTGYQRRLVQQFVGEPEYLVARERAIRGGQVGDFARGQASKLETGGYQWGYTLDEFRKMRDHPSGYVYTVYTLVAIPSDSPPGVGYLVIPVRGDMYSDPQDAISNAGRERSDALDRTSKKFSDIPNANVGTIIAVSPMTGVPRGKRARY